VWKVGDPELLAGLPDGFHAYFANSYYVDFDLPDLVGGRTRYGATSFLSAVSRGTLHATQFHPEKSQRAGLHLLRTFGRLAGATLTGAP
jgi:glutamine amidotransferase